MEAVDNLDKRISYEVGGLGHSEDKHSLKYSVKGRE